MFGDVWKVDERLHHCECDQGQTWPTRSLVSFLSMLPPYYPRLGYFATKVEAR